jgi:hypothetical protein
MRPRASAEIPSRFQWPNWLGQAGVGSGAGSGSSCQLTTDNGFPNTLLVAGGVPDAAGDRAGAATPPFEAPGAPRYGGVRRSRRYQNHVSSQFLQAAVSSPGTGGRGRLVCGVLHECERQVPCRSRVHLEDPPRLARLPRTRAGCTGVESTPSRFTPEHVSLPYMPRTLKYCTVVWCVGVNGRPRLKCRTVRHLRHERSAVCTYLMLFCCVKFYGAVSSRSAFSERLGQRRAQM